jgi:hypothetical protein
MIINTTNYPRPISNVLKSRSIKALITDETPTFSLFDIYANDQADFLTDNPMQSKYNAFPTTNNHQPTLQAHSSMSKPSHPTLLPNRSNSHEARQNEDEKSQNYLQAKSPRFLQSLVLLLCRQSITGIFCLSHTSH